MTYECPIAVAARKSPGSDALQVDGRRWTYAELDVWTATIAAALSTRGLSPGDRVAVLSNNRAELVPLLFAIWRRGAVVVMLNARLTRSELEPQLALVEPTLRVADSSLIDRIEGAEAMDDLRGAAAAVEDAPSRSDESAAAILFTSGTTGRAKAAVLTWGNFIAAANASAANIGGAATDAWLLCLPLFHIGGLSMMVRTAVYGAKLVLHPRFDAAEVARSLDEDGISHASLVAVGLQRIVALREGRPFPRTIQAVLVGGGPVSADLLGQARALELPVLQTYGLTEACAQVATERPDEADGTTAGAPLPGVEVRIVDAEGASLHAGEIGEIEVRSPTVMAGYYRDESETHQTLWKGWLRTKDLGTLDDRGRLRVFARRTDLIISGGENIYPAEIEGVLLRLPGVREAAVLGAPDERWGQVPVAIVAGGAALEAGTLARACASVLAGYKVPRRYVFVEALPRNAMGKVDRQELRKLADRARSPQ